MEGEDKFTQTSDVKVDNVMELRKWGILKDLPTFLLSQVQYAMVARRKYSFGWDGYALLVTRDDQVYVMGDNEYGKLGFSRAIRKVEGATKLEALSGLGVIGFSSSWNNVAAWTNDGKLYMMGSNYGGQLGQNLCKQLTGPHQVVKGLATEKVIKAVCGEMHTVCLTAAGNVYSWGYTISGVRHGKIHASAPLRVVFPTIGAIIEDLASCASASFFALSADGKLYGWGFNEFGQVGIDSTADEILNPTQIIFPDSDIKAIACGHSHCLVLTQDGSMFGWGRNSFGEIGNGNTDIVRSPVRINLRAEVMEVKTCNALSTSFCKTWNGSVWSWGRSAESIVPIRVRFEDISNYMASKDLGMCETWVSDERKPMLEPDLRTYCSQSTDVEFEAEGKRIMASKFFLKRCQAFRNKLQHEWKQELNWSGIIPIDGFSFAAFKSFIHFLHTDAVVAEERDFKELLKIARTYAMESFHASVLSNIKKKINTENAVQYYMEAIETDDAALGLIALDFIKSRAVDILSSVDLNVMEAPVVKKLMQDIKAMGAFKPS